MKTLIALSFFCLLSMVPMAQSNRNLIVDEDSENNSPVNLYEELVNPVADSVVVKAVNDASQLNMDVDILQNMDVDVLQNMDVDVLQNMESVSVEVEDGDDTDSAVVVDGDTLKLRFGGRSMKIISGNEITNIDIERLDDFKSSWDDDDHWTYDGDVCSRHKKNSRRFKGHWFGVDLGSNQLPDPDYSIYPEGTPDFLATSPERSFEVNVNIYEYSFGFSPYIGIVSGVGFSFNNYKFKNDYTLRTDLEGIVQPVELNFDKVQMSKLTTFYLTVPLLLEFQIPGHNDNQRMYISGGVIGGLKLKDHTKIVINNEKSKDNSDFNVSPFRYGATARLGFDNFGVYGTYYPVSLFEKDKGPETYPWTVGISISL